MSIGIKWPDDMDVHNEDPDVKIITNVETEEDEQFTKPKNKTVIEEVFIEDDVEDMVFDFPKNPYNTSSSQQPENTNGKKKSKFCNREIIKDGKKAKCKQLAGSCPLHICKACKEHKLKTDECTHKPSYDYDRKIARLNPRIGGEHLYNLQFSCYLTMETLLQRTDARYRVDGLTEKLEEKRDAYKQTLTAIYEEYGGEIDTIVSPIMTWAMLTATDVGTSVYENQKKE